MKVGVTGLDPGDDGNGRWRYGDDGATPYFILYVIQGLVSLILHANITNGLIDPKEEKIT